MKAKYHLSHDEMPFVAEKILHNLKRDRKLFESHNKQFNQQFIDDFELKLKKVEQLTDPVFLSREVARLKKKLGIMVGHLRPLLNYTQQYIDAAKKDLPVEPEFFQIDTLRKNLYRKKEWRVQKSIRKLLERIAQYQPILEKKGFQQRIVTDFNILMENVHHVELELAESTHQRDMAVIKNIKTMNDLWESIELVCHHSVPILSGKHRGKLKDYDIERMAIEAHELLD